MTYGPLQPSDSPFSGDVILGATLFVSNLPLLFFGMGGGFVEMVFNIGLSTMFYPYAPIPLLTVVSPTALNYK
jgi:hypothetical protein